MSEGAMEKMIKKFCEVNKAKFVGFSGTYNFVDEDGVSYFLTQSDLRDLIKKM